MRRFVLITTEKLRLFVRGDSVVYEATPSGQRLTEFVTGATGTAEIILANPNHDFPQRIVYRRAGADSMVARIEGDRAGRRQPVSYLFRKSSCPATFESPVSQTRTALQPKYDDMLAREAL